MQKLSLKLKNVPTNASLVCSSTNSLLNKEETLSVESKVLDDNNLEVNLPENTQGFKNNYVFVLSIEGKPLMPCTPCKAKKLLKLGKAQVIKRKPFTIQLNFECENKTQDITLGIDSGYKFIGFSAVTDKKEVISGELELDNKTSDRLKEKAMYRRNRRNKLWYREPRFNNRVKDKGWLPPSIQRKYDTHINLINKIKKLLPISKVIVEVGNFDIQKINNQDISGKEYQKGNLYGYQNMKSYLISREKGLCQLCNKEKGNDSWNIHHIKQRNDGGTDKESNLALLHKSCHDRLHKEGLVIQSKNKTYKESTFMNIIKNRFTQDLDCDLTYGYITSVKRFENKIEKSHSNDAFIIANGNNLISRCSILNIKQKHRNNRVLQINRKGFKPSIRRQRYKIQPMDLVKIDGKIYTCKGTHSYGKQLKVRDYNENIFNFAIKKVQWSFNYGSFIF